MLKCLIALTSLLCAAAAAAPVWTWVDANGQRHYSDRPVEGATQIEIAAPQTFSSSRPTPATPPSDASSAAGAADPYSILELLSPADQDTLFNIEGTLTVQLATYPALQTDHGIDLVLDGEYRAIGASNLTFTIPEVPRGTHTLQAVIVDASGEELIRSAPVTFFVRQNSILTPPPQRVPPQANPPLPTNN